jgi:hypothetical protein
LPKSCHKNLKSENKLSKNSNRRESTRIVEEWYRLMMKLGIRRLDATLSHLVKTSTQEKIIWEIWVIWDNNKPIRPNLRLVGTLNPSVLHSMWRKSTSTFTEGIVVRFGQK